jgi:DNA invertase Pin-like site-specific DNA recombinase
MPRIPAKSRVQGVQLAKSAGKYTGRKADNKTNENIVELRKSGHSIRRTSELTGCSISQVKRIWALHQSNP